MIYLLLSVVLNGFLLILFKYFSQWKIDLLTAIVVNYFTAFLVGLIVSGNDILATNPLNADWTGPLLTLGICFILGFNAIAYSIKYAGITITTIMQKITFLTVVFYAIFVFGEKAEIVKIIGVCLASIAVILVSLPNKKRRSGRHMNRWIFLLPILTFLISSVIDVTFYHITFKNIASSTDIPFISYVFLVAGLIGGIFWLGQIAYTGERPLDLVRHIKAGILLGVPNFFAIYFLMAMLESGWSGAILYPINNLGILLFASVSGMVIFKEKLDRNHLIGFILAIIAISALIISNYIE